MINIIATVGKNMEIGKDDSLLWDYPNIRRFIKKMTINHTVIMGRKTFLELGYAFPNRYNIVISKSLDNYNGVEIVENIQNVLDRYLDLNDDVYIVGGESMFSSFIPYTSKIYLTVVDDEKEANRYFPDFDSKKYTKKILGSGNDGDISYTHILYELK